MWCLHSLQETIQNNLLYGVWSKSIPTLLYYSQTSCNIITVRLCGEWPWTRILALLLSNSVSGKQLIFIVVICACHTLFVPSWLSSDWGICIKFCHTVGNIQEETVEKIKQLWGKHKLGSGITASKMAEYQLRVMKVFWLSVWFIMSLLLMAKQSTKSTTWKFFVARDQNCGWMVTGNFITTMFPSIWHILFKFHSSGRCPTFQPWFSFISGFSETKNVIDKVTRCPAFNGTVLFSSCLSHCSAQPLGNV